MKSPLRLVREKRGLTLKAVADAVAMDQGNLSRVERGEQTPSTETAEALTKFFGHEVSEMQILYPERYVKSPEIEQ